MEAAMKLGKFYFLVCCILLCIRLGYSVELQPSSDSVEVCSGTVVQVNCTTETDDLYWRTTPACKVSYDNDDTDLVGDVTPFCDFEAILLSTSPSLMSTATLSNVNSSHNGTVLTCVNTIVQVGLKPEQMANITFLVRGPPSFPLSPSISPQSLSSVVLSWTPSDADCVAKYTIILTNIAEGNIFYIYNTATNTTSMTVSDLTQGADYLFAVAGIDGEGRVGQYSDLSEVLMLDVPGAVLDLKASITPEAIIVTWMPPPPSSRPPVTEYEIRHNTTGSNLTVTKTEDTEYIVEYTIPGVYLFIVLARNVLGDGNGTSILLTVEMTDQVLSSKTSTSTAAANTRNPTSPIISSSMCATESVTQVPMDVQSIVVPVAIASTGVTFIVTMSLVLIVTAIIIARSKSARSPKAEALAAEDNLTYSENVAYGTARNTLRMSSQAKMTCTENTAYSTVSRPRDDSVKITPASRNVTYDEVTLK